MAETQKTLAEYLAEKPNCKGFNARPHYFQDGDFVSYYFREDPAFEERIDELLTIYFSMDTGEMVGCKIKGVRRILQELGNFSVTIEGGNVTLGLLFVGAALVNPSQKGQYEKLGSEHGKVPLDPEELRAALAA
jgi:hypothetical protein